MIAVFGSINIDLVTQVDRIAAPGETVIGASYAAFPGGKGANQALAARRAGADVLMVGAVGRDGFAAPALALLRDAGVDLSAVAEVEVPTGAAFIAVDAEGRNAITVAGGANALARAAALGDFGPGASGLLLLQREVPDAEGAAAAGAARARGMRVVLNLAPSGAVRDSYLRLVDVMVVNEHEAADLARTLGLSDDHAGLAAHLDLEFGIGATVVTLGAAGAVGWQGGAEHRVPCPAVEVLDTTAAGDSFVGAFAAALDAGLPFPDALRRGSAAGSLACTVRGAQPSIPHAAAVDALLAAQGG